MTPYPYYSAPPAKSRTLGVVALVAAVAAIVFSVTLSVIVGNLLGPSLQPGESFSQGFQAGASSTDPHVRIGGLIVVAQLLFGTGLGVWGFAQGIVAVRSDRGRGWGIAAIVVAVIAPILSLVVYIAVGAVAAAANQ